MLEANAQVPLHAHPLLREHGVFDPARFRENCLCSSFICADFMRTRAAVKLFCRPGCKGGTEPRLALHPSPNGLRPKSPGLRGTSYPGLSSDSAINPNGVVANSLPFRTKRSRAFAPAMSTGLRGHICFCSCLTMCTCC